MNKNRALILTIFYLYCLLPFIRIYSQSCNCKYTISQLQTYIDGNTLTIKGGDTVCISSGNRGILRLANFHGDSLHYIVFKNCGGDVIIKNESFLGITINNCSYFRFTGSGNNESLYGIKVLKTSTGSSGLSIDGLSSNYEIDHIEVANTGFAGIMAVSHPTCNKIVNRENFVIRNMSIHHNYVHNTGGEGLYIGHSYYSGYPAICDDKPDTLFPAEIKGIRVFNNIADSTGWDGLQVGCATSDCEIYGNMITNYGVLAERSQNSGIQLGGGTTGLCYNNAIIKGSGTGIMVFGLGNNLIFNNIIVNAGNTGNPTDNSTVYGIFCDDRSTIPGQSFNFINNTIIAPRTDGIRIYSNQSRNNKIYNNLILKPGSYGSYKNLSQSYIYDNPDVDVDISNNYFSQNLSPFLNMDSLDNIYQFTATLPIFFKGKDVSTLGISTDFNKTIRPLNNKPDIGAFQFNINPEIIPNRYDSVTYIYPNPNNGSFMIVNNTPDTIKKITVYNLKGLSVYEKNPSIADSFYISLQNQLDKGFYVLSIETAKNKNSYPLVIR